MSHGTERPHMPYRLKPKYGYTERIALLKSFRAFHASLGGVSVQALNDIIDDVFNTFPQWIEVRDPLFKRVFNTRLDPNTVRNLLRCDLDLGVRPLHLRSLHVVDAFLQIIARSMPEYLAKYFPEGFTPASAVQFEESSAARLSETNSPTLG